MDLGGSKARSKPQAGEVGTAPSERTTNGGMLRSGFAAIREGQL